MRAKVVVPVAPIAFQVVQWVLVRAAPASAHEMTKLLGRDTVVFVQVRILGVVFIDVEAPELAGRASAGTASAATSATGEAMRARRDMMTSFWLVVFGLYCEVRGDARGGLERGAMSRHRDAPGPHEKLKVLATPPWT